MNVSLRAGSILTALALSIAGCDPAEPKAEEPAKHEKPLVGGLGPPSPPPPVMPSPIPALPSTSKSEMKPEEKKDEAKPEEKKAEPKVEPPK